MEIINKIKDEFNRNPITLSLIIIVVIYLISKNTIEKFTSSDITTIADLAKNINGNNLTIPGNLKVSGNLEVTGTTQFNDDVNIGSNSAKKNLNVNNEVKILSNGVSKFGHINATRIYVYNDHSHNAPEVKSGSDMISGRTVILEGSQSGDGVIRRWKTSTENWAYLE